MDDKQLTRQRRLRLVGAVAYGAAALILLSTLFGVLTGTLEEEETVPVQDPTVLIMSVLWMAVVVLPLWAIRWIHDDPMIRRLAAAFVVLLVLGELSGMGYALSGGEETASTPVLAASVVLSVVYLAVGVSLGVLLRRRPEGLHGLHLELSWGLIAYVVFGAAWLAFPQLMVPLSGVALTVVYIGLGIVYRRAAQG